MKARLIEFGELEIEGDCYKHDVVIERGKVSKRDKKPSKAYRDQYGHTPLSLAERIPWGGKQLVVGTGAEGRLPIMPEVRAEAERRGVEIVAAPTQKVCQLLRRRDIKKVHAILHATC